MTSNPAASHSNIVSDFWVTPPEAPDEGEGLINTSSSRDNFSILVLSPRILSSDWGARIDCQNGDSFFALKYVNRQIQ